MAHKRTKIALQWHQERPIWPQDGPKWPQDGPICRKTGTTSIKKHLFFNVFQLFVIPELLLPEMAPRWLTRASRLLQESPKTARGGP